MQSARKPGKGPNKTDCMETNTNIFKQKNQKQLKMQGKPRKNQIVRKQTTHIFKIKKFGSIFQKKKKTLNFLCERN